MNDYYGCFRQGLARTQTPTRINCVPELPACGVIAGASPTEVQWKGLFLGKPPWWSRFSLYQVSMLRLATSGFYFMLNSHCSGYRLADSAAVPYNVDLSNFIFRSFLEIFSFSTTGVVCSSAEFRLIAAFFIIFGRSENVSNIFSFFFSKQFLQTEETGTKICNRNWKEKQQEMRKMAAIRSNNINGNNNYQQRRRQQQQQ